MRINEWEIKVSKLCNLRCTYCYEFAELGDKRRISPEGWRAILQSARWYQEETARQYPGQKITTRFVWHGGEPGLLPLSYYEEILAIQREVLGAENLNTIYFNHVPTNLYSVPPAVMELWNREKFVVSVSYDVVSGARVNAGGETTEARVQENIRQRLAEGYRLGLNTVLGAHNVDQLNEVYAHIRNLSVNASRGIYHTIIPLHSSATDDRDIALSLSEDRIVDALYKLFLHWLDDPQALPVAPLQDYYLYVLRKLADEPKRYFDRRTYGEASLMVNTDGYLYVFNETYDRDKALGNLFEQSFAEILQSQAYEASLQRQEAAMKRHCTGCPYDGYCTREPIINGHRDHQGERCAIGFALLQKMEAALAERGINEKTMRATELPVLPNPQFVMKKAA